MPNAQTINCSITLQNFMKMYCYYRCVSWCFLCSTCIKCIGFLNFSVKHLEFSSKTEEKIHKKLEGSLSPEADLSPTAKDQVEMYAFIIIINLIIFYINISYNLSLLLLYSYFKTVKLT